MGNFAEGKSLGDLVQALHALNNTAVTAGGGGDNTEVNGVVFERGVDFDESHESGVFIIHGVSTIASNETLAIIANVQTDSAVGMATAPRDLDETLSTVIEDAGAGSQNVVAVLPFKLGPADKCIRLQMTPNMSAGATDTAALTASLIVGGGRKIPASTA